MLGDAGGGRGATLGVRGDRGGVGHGKCLSKKLATSSTPTKKHYILLKNNSLEFVKNEEVYDFNKNQ